MNPRQKIPHEIRMQIADYLRDKPNLPHVIAKEQLEQMGIKVSTNTIVNLRIEFGLPYNDLSHISRSLMMMYRRRVPVTYEYLYSRWPDIEEVYADYLVRNYGNPPEEKPIVRRVLAAPIAKGEKPRSVEIDRSYYYHETQEISAPVSSIGFSVAQLMLQQKQFVKTGEKQ